MNSFMKKIVLSCVLGILSFQPVHARFTAKKIAGTYISRGSLDPQLTDNPDEESVYAVKDTTTFCNEADRNRLIVIHEDGTILSYSSSVLDHQGCAGLQTTPSMGNWKFIHDTKKTRIRAVLIDHFAFGKARRGEGEGECNECEKNCNAEECSEESEATGCCNNIGCQRWNEYTRTSIEIDFHHDKGGDGIVRLRQIGIDREDDPCIEGVEATSDSALDEKHFRRFVIKKLDTDLAKHDLDTVKGRNVSLKCNVE